MNTTNIDKFLALHPDYSPQVVTDILDDSDLFGETLSGLKNLGLQDHILISGLASLPFSVFLDWFSQGMTYGSECKVIACEPSSYAALARIANARINGFSIDNRVEDHASKKIGFNITHLDTPYGELDLVMTNLNPDIGVKSCTGNMVLIDLEYHKVNATAVAIGVNNIVV